MRTFREKTNHRKTPRALHCRACSRCRLSLRPTSSSSTRASSSPRAAAATALRARGRGSGSPALLPPSCSLAQAEVQGAPGGGGSRVMWPGWGATSGVVLCLCHPVVTVTEGTVSEGCAFPSLTPPRVMCPPHFSSFSPKTGPGSLCLPPTPSFPAQTRSHQSWKGLRSSPFMLLPRTLRPRETSDLPKVTAWAADRAGPGAVAQRRCRK